MTGPDYGDTMIRKTMNESYRLSFTFGGLLYSETTAIARRFKEISDWSILRAEALQGRLLAKTRVSSRNRYFREIRDRLKQAWPFEIDLMATDDPQARYAMLAVCCRYYHFVGDFLREAVRDKIALKDDRLELSDWFHFLEGKRPAHPELDLLSETTSVKLRQVIFRMLIEGNLLERGSGRRILVPILSPDLVRNYRKMGDTFSLDCLLQQSGT